MTPTKLPNGFVLDLDSVHYIQSETVIRHPFTNEPTAKRGLTIICEGDTAIHMIVSEKQSDEIKRLILNNLNEREKK